MCGFIGIQGGPHAAREVLEALLVLQHRGQDAAGISVFDGEAFVNERGAGLVSDVFGPAANARVERLQGRLALGHTRYPTVGGGTAADAQPLYTNAPFGIAMAHNGNVTNFQEAKHLLAERDGRRLSTTCDVEVILNVFAASLQRRRARAWPDALFGAVREVFDRVQGAYSVAALVGGKGLVAFRDPHGVRPAVLGRRRRGRATHWCVASESAALNVLGFRVVGDLDPGEVVFVDERGRMERRVVVAKRRQRHRPCVFEYIYFARPDSLLDDISVYRARLRLGEALADLVRARGLEPDVVVPVPDSARPAALECARALDVRYREGLLKNRYVGRTFIMPAHRKRAQSVLAKLTTLPMEIAGKKVLLVDDSIVRGTTSRAVVAMVREAGAREVYLASTAPRLQYPCVYGIDMQTRGEFIARPGRTDAWIARSIGADALVYMTVERMVRAVRGPTPRVREFCKACMDGVYPTGDVDRRVLGRIARERTRAARGRGPKG